MQWGNHAGRQSGGNGHSQMKESQAGFLLKRTFDFLVALTALLISWPLILVVALVIRIVMGSPVLFRQQRPGYKEKIFTFYKFRTMSDARDEQGRLLPDEARLTRLGRLLRSWSLDELPQLWNVLKGDLSIVGPRPLLIEYLPLYTPEQRRRHEVMPGLVGWAVVNGRNANSWEQKFAFDLWYVEHRSFILDLKIIFKALWMVISREGISYGDEATMPRFTGSQGPLSSGKPEQG